MRIATLCALALAGSLCLTGCKIKEEDGDAAAGGEVAEASPTPAASEVAAPAAFDPLNVPESTASLPPFPLFEPLDGLENVFNAAETNIAFDRDYFIAGQRVIPVEGKIFRSAYSLTRDRPYSSLEFLRNHEQAVLALGGRKIGGPVETRPFLKEVENTAPAPTGRCFSASCDQADFYLIRQGGKEWWISVGTGSIPLHGYVTVLEKQGMAQSFSFKSADALKQALDKDGRVPVYIEFDVDRASIRPSARPAVDEIVKLMRANPSLDVSIEGHTDDTGTAARNKTLSLARSESVRAELIAAGIDPARMKTAGFGSEKPLARGTGEDARARNRRVELVRT